MKIITTIKYSQKVGTLEIQAERLRLKNNVRKAVENLNAAYESGSAAAYLKASEEHKRAVEALNGLNY